MANRMPEQCTALPTKVNHFCEFFPKAKPSPETLVNLLPLLFVFQMRLLRNNLINLHFGEMRLNKLAPDPLLFGDGFQRGTRFSRP